MNFQVLAHAHFHTHQFLRVTGDAKGIGRSMVAAGKALVHIFRRDRFITREIFELLRRLHCLESLFNFGKVLLG